MIVLERIELRLCNPNILAEYIGLTFMFSDYRILVLGYSATRLLTNIDRSITNLRLCDVNISESNVCSTTSGYENNIINNNK